MLFGCGLVLFRQHCNMLCTYGFMDEIIFNIVYTTTKDLLITVVYQCYYSFMALEYCI